MTARMPEQLKLMSIAQISNIWLLTDSSGRRFLVDTGFVLERPTLLWALQRAGITRKGDLTAILLTHRHSDHAGNAAWLRARFGCPVICHAADAPFLTGQARPPRLRKESGPLYERVICGIEDRFPSRSPVDEVYEDGSWRWGFRVVPVPGHTEGSVMLYHEPSATLFSGDAILAGPPPLRMIEHLYLVVHGFSLDVESCRGHVRKFLRDLPPVKLLCAGHGPLVAEGTFEKLARFAR